MVGIAIGASVQNPFIAVPLAFVTHYVGDLVPHWDFFDHFPTKKEMFSGWPVKAFFADVIFGIALGLGFTLYALRILGDTNLALNIFLCGIASVTPDGMYAPILFVDRKNKLLRFSYRIQGKMHSHAGALWGNITQFGVLILAFLLTVNLLGRL
jgi:hypothetical protein